MENTYKMNHNFYKQLMTRLNRWTAIQWFPVLSHLAFSFESNYWLSWISRKMTVCFDIFLKYGMACGRCCAQWFFSYFSLMLWAWNVFFFFWQMADLNPKPENHFKASWRFGLGLIFFATCFIFIFLVGVFFFRSRFLSNGREWRIFRFKCSYGR